MRIIHISLSNFVGIYAAMELYDFEVSFDKVDKPIIQIYGPNKCGKTVLIHQLHPFSSINLNGDERNDLSLIIPGMVGVKKIVYDTEGEVYCITHTYSPTKSTHTVSSSIIHDGKELNPSGGVSVFNNLIEKLLGINKYIFQFVINGTQLMSFANRNYTQRKQLMNKAMGIDIYDKINRLATDDYRYINKLITSLNNTKEYLLSSYGSYENLSNLLKDKQSAYDMLTQSISTAKSKLDNLLGTISVIKQQNVSNELLEVNNQISLYENIISSIGSVDDSVYDKLVDEQIVLNNTLSELRNNRLNMMKDVDNLYAKKNEIENNIRVNQNTIADYNNMLSLSEELKNKIAGITIEIAVSSSANYLCNMLNLAQTVNSIGKEIISCLNEKHLKLLTEMVIRGIDVSAFLIKEGNILMDTDKEKSVISRIRSVINSIDGEYIDDDCPFVDRCIYRRTYNTLDTYFKSYQSVTASSFTQYDIEQFNHAYKNIQTIARLINTEISEELANSFDIETILLNLCNNKYCIDVAYIKMLIEETAKIEMRNRYINQLSNVDKSINDMKEIISNIKGETSDSSNSLQSQINTLQSQILEFDKSIYEMNNSLSVNENKRHSLSQIKNINIKELRKRYEKLNKLATTLSNSESEYNQLNYDYNVMSNNLVLVTNELETLSHANTQYMNTMIDIEKNLLSDNKYKVIAEATSSTKGKPVIAIRNEMENALLMTNRLLNVMYDGELEMLTPEIDENLFTLPFRSKCNISADIRYGSQSESSLLSLALSLSIASSLSTYNIPLIDEIDAYLDNDMRSGFIMMIQEIMSTLKMEQLFIISHNMLPDQYEHIVHVQNISI